MKICHGYLHFQSLEIILDYLTNLVPSMISLLPLHLLANPMKIVLCHSFFSFFFFNHILPYSFFTFTFLWLLLLAFNLCNVVLTLFTDLYSAFATHLISLTSLSDLLSYASSHFQNHAPFCISAPPNFRWLYCIFHFFKTFRSLFASTFIRIHYALYDLSQTITRKSKLIEYCSHSFFCTDFAWV